MSCSWQLIVLLYAGFLSSHSYALINQVVNEAFEVRLFSGNRVNRLIATPAVGAVQVLIHSDDDTGEVKEIEKITTGRFMVLVDDSPVTLSFLSKVSLLATGQVVLEVKFTKPELREGASHQKLSPEAIYREGRLHFWHHIVPSEALSVRVVVGEQGVETTITVNNQGTAFFRGFHDRDFNRARLQTLGWEFINAVLSHDPPSTFQSINLIHALDHYFTFTRMSSDMERPFSLEVSGVTYSYPLFVAHPEREKKQERPIYTRYAQINNGSYVYGTQRVQIHRLLNRDIMPELTTDIIHHPGYLLTLLASNVPTLAEVAERTYFLNLNDVRAHPGVEVLLARFSLPGGREEELLPALPSEPTEVMRRAAEPKVPTESTPIPLHQNGVLLTTAAMVSEGGRRSGEHYVSPELEPSSRRRSRLPVFEGLFNPNKQVLPLGIGGASPQPPGFPFPVSSSAGGTIQNPYWPQMGLMGFGSLNKDEDKDKDKDKKKHYPWY